MKKLLLLFTLLMPLMASADSVVIDGIYYELSSSNNTAEVESNPSKYTGSVTIPATVTYQGSTYKVTHIGQVAFKDCTDLTSVTIPNSVIIIHSSAFSGCSGLTTVTIPNSVTTIGSSAFRYCTGLTSVSIGNNVTEIGYSAFEDCNILKSVEIPNSVTSMGSGAFRYCYDLTTVTIPSSVTKIDNYTFYYCESLTSITIPSSVTTIGSNAFTGCTGLTSVTCEATSVPSTGSNVFDEVPQINIPLFVPESALEAYEKTKPWNGFGIIAAIGSEPVVEGIDINETNFPDENFRNWVLSQDYGKDGILTDAEIYRVEKIYVQYKSIHSLQGIEFFTALTHLYCTSNRLTSLDMSNNTALTYLDCDGNGLNSLNVSNNTALTYLVCGANRLTSLNVSNNTALTMLDCDYNQLTSLDVSRNRALTELKCKYNKLASIDVSNHTALKDFQCSNNQLTSLDVSNTALTELNCSNNQLTSLDVSNMALTELTCSKNQLISLDVSNTALTKLDCSNNQIKGKEMDALVKSLPYVINGDMRVIIVDFTMDSTADGNIMTTTQVAAAIAKGWTPRYYDGSRWQEYAGSEPVPVEKCATPTISFVDGKLEFSCETEGVEFVTNITSSDSGNYEGNSIPLTSTYIVSVYAKKAGYADSDVATEEITAGGTTGIRGDVNGDNEVGMPDVMYIVNYILNGRFPDENLQSPRVRFGIFETVAGYSVTINSINVDYNLTIGTDAIGSALNTTASNPTWDTANGEYSAVQPNEANTNPMLIKLDYTLTSEDGSGENIVVRNAEVEVPAEVLKWQSNKDYTYIMKIGDNPDWKPTMKLAELFPITLWGVEIKENSNNVTR